MLKKSFLTGVLFFLLLNGNSVSADVFSLHFVFNEASSRLDFDTSNGSPVTIDTTKTIATIGYEQIYETGNFEASFLDTKGYEFDRKIFDVKKGAFTVDFPRYSIAQTVKIYRIGQSDPILTYDLSDLVLCNGNNICEYEKGENFATCLADCTGTDVQFSEETTTTLQQNGGVVRDPKTGDILLNDVKPEPTPQDTPQTQTDQSKKSPLVSIALLVAGILMLVGVAVYFIRRRR